MESSVAEREASRVILRSASNTIALSVDNNDLLIERLTYGGGANMLNADSVFSLPEKVSIDGVAVALSWQFVSKTTDGETAEYLFADTAYGLRLRVTCTAVNNT